mmetsp:Transcript_38426/g.44044  ORF Transcript_38426/g.44044 Transcript_38426/m.44044 type:complete len:112 (+) Transcript_38426:2089-2424(+)
MRLAQSMHLENALEVTKSADKKSLKRQDREAKQARDLLKLSILEVRALKNRLGIETIAEFLVLYKQYLQADRLSDLENIINEGLLIREKSKEFLEFFNKIHKFEQQIQKVK